MTSAFYTDLTTGAWHITFYTLFLSAWTGVTSLIDCYLLEEAKPGTATLQSISLASSLWLWPEKRDNLFAYFF